MNRPYFRKTGDELKALVNAHREDIDELKLIAKELTHRRASIAKTLLADVRQTIEILGMCDELADRAEAERAKKQARANECPKDEPHVVECQSCGQNLQIKLDTENRNYHCPKCKAEFTASFRNSILTVVFEKFTARQKASDGPITLDEAYELFEASPGAPWEQIELNRRRIIQQYHPDKVAKLGPKVKEIAEQESKRINVAFQLIKRARGL